MKENSGAFISEMEKEVVLLRHRGNSFVVIAKILNSSAIKVEKIYKTVMEKLKLLQTALPEDAENIFPCDTISDFVDQLGVGSGVAGRNELIEAIRFSYKYPKYLESLQTNFFPRLAGHLNMSATLVSGRVYRTVKYTYYEREKKGTAPYVFYRRAGLIDRHEINLKRFFLTAHECIGELYNSRPETF